MGSHGTPDWADERARSTVYGGIDLAEHASRLGWPGSFDGRGDVIWFDDFESGINKWVKWSQGFGASVLWSPDKPKNGGFSCKLITGSNLTRAAQIRRWFAYPVLSNLGLEFSFAIDDKLSYMQVDFTAFTGAKVYMARLKYDYENSKLQYMDNLLAFQDIFTNLDLEDTYQTYNTIKVVGDFNAGLWTRVILNEQSSDLSAISLYSSFSATTPQLRPLLYFKSIDDENATNYIDDVIVTQNEP